MTTETDDALNVGTDSEFERAEKIVFRFINVILAALFFVAPLAWLILAPPTTAQKFAAWVMLPVGIFSFGWLLNCLRRKARNDD